MKSNDFFSTGKSDSNQARHPPFKTYTRLYPFDKSFRAKLALVCSLGHAQYKISFLSFEKLWAQDSKFSGEPLIAPSILSSLDCQSVLPRTSITEISGLPSMSLSWFVDIIEISEAFTVRDNKTTKMKVSDPRIAIL
ncbi:hypothetical protein N9C84_01680 [Desulfobacterales bacterium]|nr:hypothetical protein [Desulfobacterales bacterium]